MFGRVCTAAKWHAACLLFPVGSPGVFALAWNGKLVTEPPIEVRHECVGWHAARLATVLTLFFVPYLTSAQGSVPEEYRTKASYLATFPSFIEWPETAFSSPDAPFLVCVLGDFRFGTALAEFARSSSPHGRRIDIRWAHKNDDLRRCHILFISSSEESHLKEILSTLDKANVLTVSDIPQFTRRGGMIQFVLDSNRVRFEINLTSAERANLTLSSQLLKVAITVRRDSHPGI